ncbi:hypothetical protein [Pseudoalteromonas neustonica]|uniref:hypothetical protein n=1 Tax=Pseudoalteromonas neustonica TaxID=1840331 RepID=UPI0007DB52BB|nr:hypothetical protein [Pseudoalteromonas neustonica]
MKISYPAALVFVLSSTPALALTMPSYCKEGQVSTYFGIQGSSYIPVNTPKRFKSGHGCQTLLCDLDGLTNKTMKWGAEEYSTAVSAKYDGNAVTTHNFILNQVGTQNVWFTYAQGGSYKCSYKKVSVHKKPDLRIIDQSINITNSGHSTINVSADGNYKPYSWAYENNRQPFFVWKLKTNCLFPSGRTHCSIDDWAKFQTVGTTSSFENFNLELPPGLYDLKVEISDGSGVSEHYIGVFGRPEDTGSNNSGPGGIGGGCIGANCEIEP